jgi:hypothetical protein
MSFLSYLTFFYLNGFTCGNLRTDNANPNPALFKGVHRHFPLRDIQWSTTQSITKKKGKAQCKLANFSWTHNQISPSKSITAMWYQMPSGNWGIFKYYMCLGFKLSQTAALHAQPETS